MRKQLPKPTKLCSNTAIERLFARNGESATTIAYPLRAVWRNNGQRNNGDKVQFLISIPKRKLRHAVDRVTMRRRVREAYRINRHDFLGGDKEPTTNVDLGFVYVADRLMPYQSVENSVKRILQRLATSQSSNEKAE